MKAIYKISLISLSLLTLVSCRPAKVSEPTSTTEPTKETITYGEFPQTVVEDQDLISQLSSLEDTDLNARGYFELEGKEYAKFTCANPSKYVSDSGNTTFIKGNTYYFLVEPITWEILSSDNSSELLVSKKTLSFVQYFNNEYFDEHATVSDTDREKYRTRTIDGNTIYANNYLYSNIRAYLNGYDGTSYSSKNYTDKGFYNIAFSEDEISNVMQVDVDNSSDSTGHDDNQFQSDDTQDFLFALSYKEAKEYFKDDKERVRSATDYAKAQDTKFWSITTDETLGDTNGASYWWLRSPYGYDDLMSYYINPDGEVDNDVNSNYVNGRYGLVPAFYLSK